MELYQIIFNGNMMEGFIQEEVKKNIAQLYNVDVKEIDRLFTGEPIVLKTDLDYETALKDKKTFEKTGAKCQVEFMGFSSGPPPIPQETVAGQNSKHHFRSSQYSGSFANNRKYTFFQALYMSSYSKDLYQDVCQNWKGLSFIYLLLILAVSALISTVQFHYMLSDFMKNVAPDIISQIPEITIKSGEASIREPQPYMITYPNDGKPIIIIDTTGQTKSFDKSETVLLLTKTELNTMMIAFKLPEKNEYIIDQKMLHQWLIESQSWFTVLFFPLILFTTYMFRIIQVLFYSLIGNSISKNLKLDLGVQSLINIAIMSLTPIIILDFVFRLIGIFPTIWYLFFGILIEIGLIYFGIKANIKSVPQNRTTE